MSRKTFILVAGLALLAGCNKYEENVVDVREDLVAIDERFDELTDPARRDVDRRDSNVRITDDIWVGAEVRTRSSRNLLPRELEGERSIVFNRPAATTFATLVAFVSESTGMTITYAPELGGTVELDIPEGLFFTGPLSRLLNAIASAANVSWRYHPDDGEIEFYRYVTRTFRVSAFAGATTATATAGVVSTAANYEVWDEIVESVDSIIGDDGEVVEIGSNGYLVVTTTPRTMRRVAEFIEHQNSERLRQVVVNLVIYSVTLDDSQAVGVNVNQLIFQRLGGRFAFNSGGAGNVDGGLSATFSVLTGDNAPATTPGSYFAGSNAVFSALGSLGDTSIVTTASLVTLNDQPAPLQVTNGTNYLSGTTVSVDAGVTTSASETATATGGIDLLVRPRVLEDNRIRLTLSLALTEIIRIDNFPVGAGSIQLPQTTTRNFLNQVVLDNGDTMVLSGYERAEQTANRAGLTPGLWVLGGSTSGADKRQVMVLTVQPVILTDSSRQIPSRSIEG